METVNVKLSSPELFAAAITGVSRRLASIQRSLNKNVHAQKSDWATDINGAAAEMAVSKICGVYWGCHVNNLTGDDVLGGIQVRSTTHTDGHLIIRDRDVGHQEQLFVLAITNPPFVSIVGCIRGIDAMQDKYKRQSNDKGVESWWVPQTDLISPKSALNLKICEINNKIQNRDVAEPRNA